MIVICSLQERGCDLPEVTVSSVFPALSEMLSGVAVAFRTQRCESVRVCVCPTRVFVLCFEGAAGRDA